MKIFNEVYITHNAFYPEELENKLCNAINDIYPEIEFIFNKNKCFDAVITYPENLYNFDRMPMLIITDSVSRQLILENEPKLFNTKYLIDIIDETSSYNQIKYSIKCLYIFWAITTDKTLKYRLDTTEFGNEFLKYIIRYRIEHFQNYLLNNNFTLRILNKV